MTQVHEQYDAIIIGVGQAGNPLATALSQAGGAVLTIRDARGERELEGSHLLVATGRTPNTERLNLPAAGVHATTRDTSMVTNG